MAEIENHKRVRLESTQVAALKKQKLSSSGPNSPSSTSNLDQEDEADVNAASFDADHHSLEVSSEYRSSMRGDPPFFYPSKFDRRSYSVVLPLELHRSSLLKRA